MYQINENNMGVPLEKEILYLPELTLIFYVIGGFGLR
jgi:hypothetical protein